MFSALYELFIGENPDLAQEFRGSIFPSVGLLTIVFAIILAAVFYLALGRWRPVWDKRVHWVLTLTLAAIIGFVYAYTQASGTLGGMDDTGTRNYVIQFALFNAVFIALYFLIFSLVLKRFSIYARHTPVKF